MTDAYHKFLGIRPEEQPPNHYRLLAVGLFEDDSEVISNAARSRCQYLRTVSLQRPELTEPLLNEVMAAKQCLLNAKRRSEYDAALRAEMAKSPPTRLSPGAPAESKPARLLADSEEAAASLSDESWQLAPPLSAPERPSEWVVGSGSGASIRLRGRWVSRAHCRLWESDGVTWIEDLGSTNGTYVNEVAVSAPVELREGDLVTLGRRTRLPWPLPAQLAGRDLRAYLIGRDPECDYAIDDRSVSQHHAQLLIESGRAMLQDLGSLNGTRVGSLDQFLAGGEWWELPGHVSVYFGSHKVFAQDLLGRVGGA